MQEAINQQMRITVSNLPSKRGAIGKLVCLLLVLVIPAIQATAAAVTTETAHFSGRQFPASGIILTQKNFWKLIFAKYESSTIIIHDAFDPGAIVDVIPFNKLSEKYSLGALSPELRDSWTEKYLERYRLAARRVSQLGHDALSHGSMERRIYDVYHRSRHSWARLRAGRYQLRVQTGMADSMLKAVTRAQVYLPVMEKIFQRYGVPVQATRLAFVESMFNFSAKSKVGAGGLFQFMVETARNYMVVNRYFDERYSPLKAARGAAKLLADNYRLLKSWPVAITAYNHGTAGMQRAVQSLGTSDISTIVASYQSPSFGFASRNFYGELLAAIDVYDKMVSSGKMPGEQETLQHLSVLKLSAPISLEKFLKLTRLDERELMRHNSCITEEALGNKNHAIFPKNYQLLIPKDAASHALRNLQSFARLTGS
jgi:membrane-bound lytic murein transglycosylase D